MHFKITGGKDVDVIVVASSLHEALQIISFYVDAGLLFPPAIPYPVPGPLKHSDTSLDEDASGVIMNGFFIKLANVP